MYGFALLQPEHDVGPQPSDDHNPEGVSHGGEMAINRAWRGVRLLLSEHPPSFLTSQPTSSELNWLLTRLAPYEGFVKKNCCLGYGGFAAPKRRALSGAVWRRMKAPCWPFGQDPARLNWYC